MEKTLNQIRNMLVNKRIDADIRELPCGFYYDGVEHGTSVNAVFVFIDPSLDEYATAKLNYVRSLERRFRKHVFNENWSGAYYTFKIMSEKEDIRRKNADAEADIFHDAFWNYIHLHGSANNAHDAINAGHTALKRAGLR